MGCVMGARRCPTVGELLVNQIEVKKIPRHLVICEAKIVEPINPYVFSLKCHCP